MEYRELELAGICVPELLDRLMHNADLTRKIIGKFISDRSFAKLKDAIVQGDMQAAESACHTLKGICGNLAHRELFALTQKQLSLFRLGDYNAAIAMMDCITEEYDRAIDHLKLWLEEK